MITKEQAFTCHAVHEDGCTKDSKGKYHIRVWRKNGMVKEWKRQPKRFRMPVKYGWRTYDYVDEYSMVHLPEDCPLLKEDK